jgi:hypothetical protein
VGLHDLARGVRGRGDHSVELAEPEHHERAVAPREVAQRAVRERAGEVVQVADDR